MTKARRSVAEGDAVHFGQSCRSHPEDGSHECLPAEMRCAYCGCRIHPYPCNGCGRFLTAREMHENESRCDDCI